ncbi:bile acid:sodium symporter [Nocardia sp. SYP-A9097]|uniref:bile acid:sodium symporter n=1 Tax=Nocardia sp. SYP-A9097 TaxID=2663237 RepID=UPI001E40215E
MTQLLSRALRFERADRMVMVFCGAQKSLTIGLPLSAILFSGPPAGVVIIPVIIYHRFQLIVCSVLARRYQRTGTEDDTPDIMERHAGQLR